MAAIACSACRPLRWPACLAGALVLCAGCSQRTDQGADHPALPTRVLAVAPVLNLSGNHELDPLRFTDLIASECLSFPGVAVIPVNRTLAELSRQGKERVETPEDAVQLARTLGADATIVTAVTEYDPYDPPVVGLLMQWYSADPSLPPAGFDPVTASRATSSTELRLSAADPTAPRWQIQRVFDADDEELLKQIRAFAARRGGHQSPYGWHKYTKSQELYVRYCGWALIRTMLLLNGDGQLAVEPDEADT